MNAKVTGQKDDKFLYIYLDRDGARYVKVRGQEDELRQLVRQSAGVPIIEVIDCLWQETMWIKTHYIVRFRISDQ